MAFMDVGERYHAHPYFTPPASRRQLLWMTVAAVVGVIAGIIVIAIAFFNDYIRSEVWWLFGVCEGLASITGVIALTALRERTWFFESATGLIIKVEEEQAGYSRMYGSKPRDFPRYPLSYTSRREVTGYRDAFIASGDFDIALRLQNVLTRLQEDF